VTQNIANNKAKIQNPAPAVSVFNFHYASPPDTVAMNYALNKVIGDNETGFRKTNDLHYRMEGWQFILAGGGLYNNLDYSFTVGHEDGSDVEPNGPGGGSPELRRRLKILSEFLNGLPLVKMRPDFELVKQAGGVVTHALSSERGEYAMYLDGDGPTFVILNLPAGEYAVWWVDVVSGEKKDEGTFKHAGGEKRMKSPVSKGGIAVRISRGESK
jgi:hypothetical protein